MLKTVHGLLEAFRPPTGTTSIARVITGAFSKHMGGGVEYLENTARRFANKAFVIAGEVASVRFR